MLIPGPDILISTELPIYLAAVLDGRNALPDLDHRK